MSDTPRTDVAEYESQDEPVAKLGAVDAGFARQLERELNAANVEIEEKRKDVVWLATEKAKLEQRIKRLEEAGDAMEEYILDQTNTRFIVCAIRWREAKESKP